MRGPTIYFLIFVLCLQTGISWLVWRLLQKLFSVYRASSLTAIYWLTTVLAVATIALVRQPQLLAVSSDVARLAVAWLTGQLILVILLPVIYGCARWLQRLKAATHNSADGPAMSRRSFLQITGVAVPAAALGVSGYGVFGEGNGFSLQYHRLPFTNLPPGLLNFKIVQISDTHIGTFFSLAKLDEVLAAVSEQRPDLVVITGDLIDDLSLLQPTMKKLAELASVIPYGIFYCWGNHEYFRNINQIREALQNSPITLLQNSSRQIIGGETPFFLLGVDYPWAESGKEQVAKRADMFEKASRNVPQGAFSILLSHHPDFIDNAFAANIPLTLTGHTHGGQIGMFGRTLLPLSYKYMRGMYRQDSSYGYVSVGTGSWFPLRLGCPAEVTVFTFENA